MIAVLRNLFFPRIIKRPPTTKELAERRRIFVNRFVSSHAEGNIALSRGHYRTQR